MPTIAEQRDFYDIRWNAKSFANNLQLTRAIAILDGLARTRLKQPRILDVGCGTGWLTSILNRFGPTTGVELSPGAIQRANERFPDTSFVAADVSRSLPGHGYDVLVSHEVLEHFEDQAAHVSAMANALRPGGWLILTTPNARISAHRHSDDRQPIENHLTAQGLRRLLAPHFDVRDLRTIIVTGTPLRRILPTRVLERLGYGLHLYVLAQRHE